MCDCPNSFGAFFMKCGRILNNKYSRWIGDNVFSLQLLRSDKWNDRLMIAWNLAYKNNRLHAPRDLHLPEHYYLRSKAPYLSPYSVVWRPTLSH